ncbi:MAG TPA: hypothetical protein VLC46_04915 [Thermoanaerobaculia bacterium]|jgi:tetratricopeptide (TPR) repeat protein|nr:hypothetical protein [Thermoanaerobaculia bacterium]
MRHVAVAAVFLLVCPIAIAQHLHATTAPGRVSPCDKKFAEAVSQPQFANREWVVTSNGTAQKYFDQGLTQYYGFNFEEALRNFRGAAAADSTLAMAYWGIALAAGPNINLGMDDPCRAVALKAILAAEERAKTGKDDRAKLARALIHALSLRYNDPGDPVSEAVAYSVAMGKIWDQYKDQRSGIGVSVNVGALYAESMLDLRPWGVYDHCKSAALETLQIESVLENCIDNSRDALGANHFWIHTVEGGPKPDTDRDFWSAELLTRLVPASGHLVHMPSHIFLLNGQYLNSLNSNVQAVNADLSEYEESCRGSYTVYSANDKCPQLYYGHYQSHNYFFGTVSATFLGRSEQAVKLACDTSAHAQRFSANEPELQRYMTAPLLTLVMNRNWCAVLKEPEPPEECYMCPFVPDKYPLNGCHILSSVRHWARGMAYIAGANDDSSTCKVQAPDIARSRGEYDAMAKEMTKIVPPTPIGWGNNSAAAVLAIAQSMLRARISWAKGQCAKFGECKAGGLCEKGGQCEAALDEAISHLKLAVTHEDALGYDEPPQWFAPTREALGGAYLQLGELHLAEQVFDEELERHPASGRALYGKMRAQGKTDDLAFCTAWANADYTMTDEDLWPAAILDAKSNVVTTCGKEIKALSKKSCSNPSLPISCPTKME